MPASASAKSADPLTGARIASLKGSVKVDATRCPPGVERTSPQCGRSTLELAFQTVSGRIPRARRLATRAIRVTGAGRSQCTSLSPTPEAVTLPDGSMQLLGPASNFRARSFDHTDIMVARTRRSLRWTWLEPTSPTVPCEYFFGSGTTEFPEAAVSERFRVALAKRNRFRVVAGADVQDFERTAPDGTKIVGDASWDLTLVYTRR